MHNEDKGAPAVPAGPMGERMSDAEIAAYREQHKRGLDAARAEADKRGPRSPHPRIVAARLAGKNV